MYTPVTGQGSLFGGIAPAARPNTAQGMMAYARNSTIHSQGEVEAMVGSFGGFMGGVIKEFESVAVQYASRPGFEWPYCIYLAPAEEER